MPPRCLGEDVVEEADIGGADVGVAGGGGGDADAGFGGVCGVGVRGHGWLSRVAGWLPPSLRMTRATDLPGIDEGSELLLELRSFCGVAGSLVELDEQGGGAQVKGIYLEGLLEMLLSEAFLPQEEIGLTEAGLLGSGVWVEADGELEGFGRFAVLFADKESGSDGVEEFAVLRELLLDSREEAVAGDDLLPVPALGSSSDGGDAEVSVGQIDGRLPPGGKDCLFGGGGAAIRPALDAVVGKGGVPAVLSVARGHVASDTVAGFGRVGGGERGFGVAEEAAFPVERDGLGGLVVGIVTGAAPEAATAAALALAESELLGVADDLEVRLGALGKDVVVDGEGVFQRLAGDEIGDSLAGIEDASRAEEMALLADTVPGGLREVRRIDDVAGFGFGEVSGGGSVAAIAADGEVREGNGAVAIPCAGDGVEGSCMAEDATLGDGPGEVRVGLSLVAGSEIVGGAAAVEGDGRLKEVSGDVRDVAGCVGAGADDVVDVEGAGGTVALEALPGAAAIGKHGDAGAGNFDHPGGLLRVHVHGVGHTGAGEAVDLLGVAATAPLRVGGSTDGCRRSGCGGLLGGAGERAIGEEGAEEENGSKRAGQADYSRCFGVSCCSDVVSRHTDAHDDTVPSWEDEWRGSEMLKTCGWFRGRRLELHGELVVGVVGAGLGIAGEVEDEALEDEAFGDGGGTELEVGAGDEAEGTGEVAAGFIAASLADDVVGGEGRHAEALPERLPDGAGVADVCFEDDEHLAKGAGEHVEVADGGIVAAVGGVEQAVQEQERARGRSRRADGVGELVKRALLGREDHGFDVAEGDAGVGLRDLWRY